MTQDMEDRYRLAGLDDRERGFNRLVEVRRSADGYLALLQYEAIRIGTPPCPSPPAALERLVKLLQGRGYRQLRSQLSFRGGSYLGSAEPWIEYQDPVESAEPPSGWFRKLAGWIR